MKRSNDEPLVSVIIPTRDSEATIEKCLKSLMEESYKNLEIIVVDNHSGDKTREIAKKCGAKIYLKGPERSAQLNFGAEKSRGKYIYRVDSDFILQPNVIQEAVENCERYGYDAIVIHNTSDPTVSFWARVRKVERDCYRNDELNVAARFWKRAVFESIGGFDETIVAGDDYDLHGRLVKHGFKIGRIKAEEVHIGEPRTLAEVAQKHFYYGENIGKFVRKNPEMALKQLSPFRASYFKNIPSFTSDIRLVIGFAIYQSVRYTATAIGFVAAKLENQNG